MSKHKKFSNPQGSSQLGFSLIEVLVYLFLFALFIGGGIVTAYNIFESSGRNEAKALVQAEGDFMSAKIDWTLSGVQTVNSPQVGVSDSVLWVTKWNVPDNPWIIDLSGTQMRLCRGACSPAKGLNSDNVQVSNLSFTHTFAGGSNPESVQANFTLSADTPGGLVVSQNFSTTKYLRK